MTSRTSRLGLVVFGVILGVLATELVLRLALPRVDYRFPTGRITDNRFSERAGKTVDDIGVGYTFDAGGFRASGALPPPGSPTVLFIGDSFTQGFRVDADETYPAVTCARLAARGIAARCLNAGVTGFGTAHELRLLRRLLADETLRIDAVVFQILPNNDLRDDWEDGGFGLEDGRLVVYDPPRVPAGVWWRETLLVNSVAQSLQVVKVAANAWNDYFGLDPHYDQDAFDLERRLLQAVVAAATERGIPVVMLVCATKWEIGENSSQPYDERARLDFVASAVRDLQIPWLDARTVASKEEHYIPNDGHLSAAGNALVGASLAETLAPLVKR